MFRYSIDERRAIAGPFLQLTKLSYQVFPKMLSPVRNWESHLLAEAIRGGYLDSFNYLISKGVDVNKEYEGSSPLMNTASLGLTEFASILLDQGAEINWKNSRGIPAVLMAACGWRFEMVELLLGRGADPSITATDGTNLILKCLESPPTLRKVLERFSSPDQGDDYGNTPIHSATISRLYEAIDILMEFGANVNIKDADGRTPLMYAVRHGSQDTDIVQRLLDAGADVQLQDNEKLSALHFAQTEELIDILVKKEADVTAVDIHGNTALHHRVKEPVPDLPAIKKLVDAGAVINAKNNDGITPLMYLRSVEESSSSSLIEYLRYEEARSEHSQLSSKSAL